MDILAIIERASARPLSKRKKANAKSVADSLAEYGDELGLGQPHRLAHFLAQLAHESMGFQFDKEVWGPTAAQKRYEGRKDLGNTQKGDGKRFAGRAGIQITGRYNYRKFTQWLRANIASDAPDFEVHPAKINTDPWEGLAPVWYWATHSLNRYADENNIEMVTRRINGGLNGFQDRIDWYERIALVMLGFGRSDVRSFQKSAGIIVDGLTGPQTRAAMHNGLKAMSGLDLAKEAPPSEPQAPDKAPAKKQVSPIVAALIALITAIAAAVGGDQIEIIQQITEVLQ